jgi:hypothetical protein
MLGASAQLANAQLWLELEAISAYPSPMDDNLPHPQAPAGWLEILEESEAELAAGLTVSGEVVRQMLRDSLARLEARRDTTPPRKANPRR